MGGLGEVVLSPVEMNGCEGEAMPLGKRLRRGQGAGPGDRPLLNPTLHYTQYAIPELRPLRAGAGSAWAGCG